MHSLVHNQLSKSGKYLDVCDHSKSFIPQIFKVVNSLGQKPIYFSPMGLAIQKNFDYETSELSSTHSELSDNI